MVKEYNERILDCALLLTGYCSRKMLVAFKIWHTTWAIQTCTAAYCCSSSKYSEMLFYILGEDLMLVFAPLPWGLLWGWKVVGLATNIQLTSLAESFFVWKDIQWGLVTGLQTQISSRRPLPFCNGQFR